MSSIDMHIQKTHQTALGRGNALSKPKENIDNERYVLIFLTKQKHLMH